MNYALLNHVNKCCKFGSFTLTSGKASDFYIDVKLLMFAPESLNMLGVELLVAIRSHYPTCGSVGGIEMGSIPLSSSIAVSSARSSYVGMPHFVIRKHPRLHGTKTQIEGTCAGDIVLIDDVLTTGGSLIKAKGLLEAEGHTVIGALVVVDREESEGIDFPVQSLFTKSQLKNLQNER